MCEDGNIKIIDFGHSIQFNEHIQDETILNLTTDANIKAANDAFLEYPNSQIIKNHKCGTPEYRILLEILNETTTYAAFKKIDVFAFGEGIIKELLGANMIKGCSKPLPPPPPPQPQPPKKKSRFSFKTSKSKPIISLQMTKENQVYTQLYILLEKLRKGHEYSNLYKFKKKFDYPTNKNLKPNDNLQINIKEWDTNNEDMLLGALRDINYVKQDKSNFKQLNKEIAARPTIDGVIEALEAIKKISLSP